MESTIKATEWRKKLKILFLTSPQFTSQYSRKVITEELPSGAVSHLCFRQRSSVDVHTSPNSFSKKWPVVLPSHIFLTEKNNKIYKFSKKATKTLKYAIWYARCLLQSAFFWNIQLIFSLALTIHIYKSKRLQCRYAIKVFDFDQNKITYLRMLYYTIFDLITKLMRLLRVYQKSKKII